MKRPALSPWRPGPGEWDRAAATHLLRRAGFGPEPGRVERALAEGLEATLESVLDEPGHDPALLNGVRPLLALDEVQHLQAWWMSLILAGGAPLTERVTLLWHDHFATSHDKVDDVRLMHRQNQLFRERGLGDFRALLHAVAVDPAMLVWLDGNDNKRGQANENFAREVMELFGLGIGHYTEEDVQEAARAFTGWGTLGRSFTVREGDHDPGTKRIFGQSGRFRGEDVIDLILEHPACARLVARRLLIGFTVPEPDAGTVAETAARLVANDWHVGRTLAEILRSELFFSPAARRARIAGPVELVAVTLRALGARVAPRRAAEAADHMGQALFRPPSVKGWDGGRTWINAGTWLARHNHLSAVAGAHLGREEGVRVDLRAAFGDPPARPGVAGAVLRTLLPDVDDPRLGALLSEAAARSDDVDEALATCTALALTAPEYHLI